MDAAALWSRLCQAMPDVARLASLGSLATRLDPALLRRLRRQLLRAPEAGLEADLWFSPLVEARSSDGILLRSDLLPHLRRHLLTLELDGSDNALEAAWLLTRQAHAGWPASLQLEERLTYLALADRHAQADEAWAPVLAAMADSGNRAQEIARWAVRAIPRLPEAARVRDTARAVLLGSVARIGGHAAVLPDAGMPESLRWLLPSATATRRQDWQVEARPQGPVLRRAADPGDGAPRVSLPDTRPPMLQLHWTSDDGPRQRLHAVADGQPLPLPADARDVVLRALDGRGWRLQALGGVNAAISRHVVRLRHGSSGPMMGVVLAPARVLTVADIPPDALQIDELQGAGEAPQTGLQLVGNTRDPRSTLRLLTLMAFAQAEPVALAPQPPTATDTVTVVDYHFNDVTMPLREAMADHGTMTLVPGAPVFSDGQLVGLRGLLGDDPLGTVREFLRWTLRTREQEPPLWLHYAPDDPYGKGREIDEAAVRRVEDAASAMRLDLWQPDRPTPGEGWDTESIDLVDRVEGAVLLMTPVTHRDRPSPALAPVALRAWADPIFPVLPLRFRQAQDRVPDLLGDRQVLSLDQASDEALRAALHELMDGPSVRRARRPEPALVERERAEVLPSPGWSAVEQRLRSEPGSPEAARRLIELQVMADLGSGPWLQTLQRAAAGSVLQLDLMPAQLARLALAKAFHPLPPWRQLLLRDQAWRDAGAVVARVVDEVAQALGFDRTTTARVLQQSRTPYFVTLLARPWPDPDQFQQLARQLPGAIWLCLANPQRPAPVLTGVPELGLPLIQQYKRMMDIVAPRGRPWPPRSTRNPTPRRR